MWNICGTLHCVKTYTIMECWFSMEYIMHALGNSIKLYLENRIIHIK